MARSERASEWRSDLDHYAHMAAFAEGVRFHFMFLADNLSVEEQNHVSLARVSGNDRLELITLLSALSSKTQKIGLLAIATTTYNKRFHVALMLTSLDCLWGRAAWSIVTSMGKYEGLNFGERELLDHDTCYARAREFVNLEKRLWGSWKTKLSFATSKVVFSLIPRNCICLTTKGATSVRGSPQGHPILVQAGATSKS